MIRASILASLFTVAFLSFAMVLPTVVAQSSGSSQYVKYSVTATNSTRTISATVNETIASSSKSGFSIVILELASSMSNLTYSKLVNSSEALFPVIPPIGNQSFTYQIRNYSISALISQISGGSVTFNGVTYSTTNYAFAVSVSNTSGSQMTATGQLSALPSGLLYSAVINANSYKIQVQLLETNLPLSGDSHSSNMTTIEVIGGGVAAIVVGASAFAFFRRKNASANKAAVKENEPLYHVD